MRNIFTQVAVLLAAVGVSGSIFAATIV